MLANTVDHFDYIFIRNRIEHLAAVSSRRKNPFGFHKAEILGNVGLRSIETAAYLIYRSFSRFEKIDYPQPGGVGNRFEDVGRSLKALSIQDFVSKTFFCQCFRLFS